MTSETDCIEKKILLRAPRKRVWRALTDSKEFGVWFGMKFDHPFTTGATMRGTIVGTAVDEEVARLQRQMKDLPFEITIERIEPERLFSFRWHPFAIDPNVDYSQESATLVTFELEPVEGGTRLTITESGFDKIPLKRRAEAFRANEGGWEHQTKLVEKYLARHDAPTS